MEMGSIHAAEMVKMLLSVIALTNMHRASGNEEYRQKAAEWLSSIEATLGSLRRELTKTKEEG